jgi:hypothetical protein
MELSGVTERKKPMRSQRERLRRSRDTGIKDFQNLSDNPLNDGKWTTHCTAVRYGELAGMCKPLDIGVIE